MLTAGLTNFEPLALTTPRNCFGRVGIAFPPSPLVCDLFGEVGRVSSVVSASEEELHNSSVLEKPPTPLTARTVASYSKAG